MEVIGSPRRYISWDSVVKFACHGNFKKGILKRINTVSVTTNYNERCLQRRLFRGRHIGRVTIIYSILVISAYVRVKNLTKCKTRVFLFLNLAHTDPWFLLLFWSSLIDLLIMTRYIFLF